MDYVSSGFRDASQRSSEEITPALETGLAAASNSETLSSTFGETVSAIGAGVFSAMASWLDWQGRHGAGNVSGPSV